MYYLNKQEEVVPRQRHNSHSILTDYDIHHFFMHNNEKGNDIIITPLNSFFFKSNTLFQTNPQKTIKNQKSLHEQSLLLKDSEAICDDEGHMYTTIPNDNAPFFPDTTVPDETFFPVANSESDTISVSTSGIDVQENTKL